MKPILKYIIYLKMAPSMNQVLRISSSSSSSCTLEKVKEYLGADCSSVHVILEHWILILLEVDSILAATVTEFPNNVY
jgi:hypothetical protein